EQNRLVVIADGLFMLVFIALKTAALEEKPGALRIEFEQFGAIGDGLVVFSLLFVEQQALFIGALQLLRRPFQIRRAGDDSAVIAYRLGHAVFEDKRIA